jgi:hypothetical protein
MKILLSTFFLLQLCLASQAVVAQDRQQPVLQETSNAGAELDPAILNELDPVAFKRDEQGRTYVIVDGNMYYVKEETIKFLGQPASTPKQKETKPE